ncbi:MAG TPA: hypothetical protein VF519_05335 [Mycobacteriales bacterium]|jgi:hypothetical protein
MRQRLGFVCAAVLAVLSLGGAPVAAGPGAAPAGLSAGGPKACGLDALPRDAWFWVKPPGQAIWTMGMVGDDPCHLVASSPMEIARSDDGGQTWKSVLTSASALGRVYSEQMEGAVVVPERGGEHVHVSTDGGRTFVKRGFTGGLPVGQARSQIVGVTVGAGRLYVARRPVNVNGTPIAVASTATVFAGAVEAGSDLQPVSETGTMQPVALAFDEEGGVVVIADERAAPLGGVWMYGTGTTAIEQAYATSGIKDVVVSPLKGAGRVIYAATDHGLFNSVDGGGGWGPSSSDAVDTARPEWGEPGVLFALLRAANGRPSISTDAGESFKARETGLPAFCQANSLQRSTDVPSVFLLTCRDGNVFRYLSSGADFVGAMPPDGGPPSPGTRTPDNQFRPRFRVIEMEPLKSWQIEDVRTESGSIGFDGENLYYGDIHAADSEEEGEDPPPPQEPGYTCWNTTFSTTVHRMNARTGKRLPSVKTNVQTFSVDVDRDTRTLFVQDGYTTFRGRLAGGKLAKQWTVNGQEPSCVQYSWDPTLKVFWGFSHGGSDIYLVEPDGSLASHCTWGDNGNNGIVYVGNTSLSGGAAIAAAGDGTAYLELEDDATVVRLSRRCGLQAIFRHPVYSEVQAENDAITCDTNSFQQSAIWIRDGDRRTVTAYEVPGAYCPLPTVITVTGPAKLNILGQALVCSTLRLPWGPPVAGVDVALFADSIPLGIGRSDARGKVCATYVPAVDHSPLGPSAGRKPLQAVFLGTRAFRAAKARGALTVLDNPLAPAPVAPRPAAPPVVEQPPSQPVNQPAPHVQAAMRQAQSQAQAQAQAQPVTQANPNAAVVAQQQEQPQLAFVAESATEQETATEWQMSLRRRQERPPVLPIGAAAAGMAMAYAYAYRTARQRR